MGDLQSSRRLKYYRTSLKQADRLVGVIIRSTPIDFRTALNEAPPEPGLYIIWQRGKTRPLYVGSAVNLRRRLGQHHRGTGRSQFSAWLPLVREDQDPAGYADWVSAHCEVQFRPVIERRPRELDMLERLAIGALNPTLQADH